MLTALLIRNCLYSLLSLLVLVIFVLCDGCRGEFGASFWLGWASKQCRQNIMMERVLNGVTWSRSACVIFPYEYIWHPYICWINSVPICGGRERGGSASAFDSGISASLPSLIRPSLNVFDHASPPSLLHIYWRSKGITVERVLSAVL